MDRVPQFAVVGVDTVDVTAIDSRTIHLVAPQRTGTFAIKLVSAWGDSFLDQSVTIHGFDGAQRGPALWGYPLPKFNRVDLPIIIANGDSSLVEVDLRFGTATALRQVPHHPRCLRGPGPSSTPELVVLGRYNPFNGVCTYLLWNLAADSLVRDQVPSFNRVSAHFNANRLLRGGHHIVCLVSLQPASEQCRQHEEINGVRFSPDGTRAFIYYARSNTNHVPVFSSATGDTAFTIHDAEYSGGGGFTPDSDTLYLAVSGARLLALNAATGERLSSITLPRMTEDVLVDPYAPFVYALGWTRDATGETAHLMVVDRRAMELAAVINVRAVHSLSDNPDALCYSCDNRLFIDATARRLYVLGIRVRNWSGGFSGSSSIASFSLPPGF